MIRHSRMTRRLSSATTRAKALESTAYHEAGYAERPTGGGGLVPRQKAAAPRKTPLETDQLDP